MIGPASRTVNKQIIKLANDGLSIAEIAEIVGLNPPAVASRMTPMLRDGRLKPHSERTGRRDTKEGRYRLLRKKYGRNTGGIMDILTGIPFEQSEWIYETVPEGFTVAEWIAVLLRDLIDYEMHAGK